jgi:hypothetical protein
MTPAYNRIVASSDEDKRGLFTEAAARIGTTVQNIEKDFWVCWVFDLLFKHLAERSPRFLFKGGTSLSKAYGLISRFSEDIDVTVFRSDLGEPVTAADLEVLASRKKRDRRLEAIKAACQTYIDQQLRVELQAIAKQLLESIGVDPAQLEIVLDESDPDRQTLLLRYPRVATGQPSYVRPSVKIESGAKSALDPNEPKIVVPYVASVIAADAKALEIANVRIIFP